MARLLIVDDDAAALVWMEEALSAAGHEMRGAQGAVEGLDILRGWRPDLILADILMPDLEGYSFSRMAAEHSGTPVMFVSVVRAESEAILRGVNGFIRKPCTPAALRGAVQKALGPIRRPVPVLVVDDEADAREVLRLALEPAFTVLEASDGMEALHALARHEARLLITDVHMPRLDGLRLVRAIRADPRLRELPIIVQTADRSALRAPVWTELQVANVLSKDAFLDWLLERIAHLTGTPPHVSPAPPQS